jgi:hypothetical protein
MSVHVYIHILSYYKLFLYFNLCLSVMLDSLSCSFTSIFFLTTNCSFTSKKEYGCKWTWETIQHYTETQIKVKEQLVVRKNMDVNEHKRLSNITLRHKSLMFIYIHILSYYKLFLYFNLCLSVMLDSLLCSFTSIFFLTTNCSFTLICV